MPKTSGSLYDARFEHDACGIGFVAQKSGAASHHVLELALTALCNHAHRGAVAADGKSGDGAGVLTQLPYDLLAREVLKQGLQPPARGDLAVGMVFLPRYNLAHRARARTLLEETIAEYGLLKLLWRDVPVNGDALGPWAQNLRPYIEQVLVARPAQVGTHEFERRLYLVRKRATQRAWAESISNFYIPSFSSLTVVYKGLFVAPQLPNFYSDLHDPDFKTAIAVFHQRYSTNTFPTWERAQPFRLVCHNGEINTLQGNTSWMTAREADLGRSDVWGRDAKVLAPVISPHGSDSAMLDNALDLLVQSGRDIRHALMMLAPKAWEGTADVTPQQRAFYHYHACLQEPWDGPAALSFTDGRIVGSALDRNGLRPARFVIMDDGLVIMSSEVGAVPVDEARVVQKGRLRPGEMLAVDTANGLIENDATIVARFVERQPYGQWLDQHLVTLDQVLAHAPPLPPSPPLPPNLGARGPADAVGDDGDEERTTAAAPDSTLPLAAFGYTREELLVVLRPMWKDGREAVGSMGDDTPAAAMSDVARPLFHYFKQRFAQVTNPPIDSLREEMVMSLSQRLGRRADLLSETPAAAKLLEIPGPILTSSQLAALKRLEMRDLRPPTWHHLKPATLDMTWDVAEGHQELRPAVERLCNQAAAAVIAGCTLLILSDRAVEAQRAPIPSLLAVSAVHHHLIKLGERMHCSLIIESGEPREVHHFAVLLSYGANAIVPWLAYGAIAEGLQAGGRHATGLSQAAAEHNFIQAVEKGILKVMSKMGISTLDSYCGAQIFEAIGLSDDLIASAFEGTPNFRISGVGYTDLAEDVLTWHRSAFATQAVELGQAPRSAHNGPGNGNLAAATATAEVKLESYGFYKARRGGEYHAFNPEVVRALHEVVGLTKSRDQKVGPRDVTSQVYRRFADLVERRPPTEPRDLLRIVTRGRQPIALTEVEPVAAIVRRFSTAAMSYGALSAEAHEALTIAMNRLGGASNSGEGGEGEDRYGTPAATKIKQVASGRFGVTPAYLMAAEELQIKMAQGSKPGEGGQLPGHKVSADIARVRHTTPGVALISPPPHHDIYSIEDLAQLIYDLKQINPAAAVSVKLVAEAGVGTIAAGVVKGHADIVHISGHNGGTGASPLTSIKNAGASWELGLAEAQQTLLINGLRSRVRLRVDGGFKTGLDVVLAALLGADEFSFGTAALVAVGCKMARACHLNTCPVGITTQRPDLRARFPGTPDMVVDYMTQVAQEVREILSSLGATSLDEIIGHSELLEQGVTGAAAHHLNLLPLLWVPDTGYARRFAPNAEGHPASPPDATLGDRLAADALAAWAERENGELDAVAENRPCYEIRNTDRTVGARLSGALAQRYGNQGLPAGAIVITLTGTAGQSFGAFGIHGLSLRLTGQANDYVGKGLGGAEIVIRPPAAATYVWHHNVILGNTALYGATAGELYAAGRAGERFGVRNSGARAVVEGVGDHGCEYMTGGVVVVLGKTGRNFGAGMTGGAAYVYDRDDRLPERANTQLVALRRVERAEHEAELRDLLERHLERTDSPRATAILTDWENQLPLFWRVAPQEQVAAIEAANEGVVEEAETEQGMGN
ncbi:MAG: glutamate synthase subunit alpha [Anaerolineae bacterium]|nr:glutamate synthase subunit alpha [Anaerolineae bacterium]